MKIWRYIFGFALICAALVGGLAYREAHYGAGPYDSSGNPIGQTVEIAFVSNAVGGTVTLIDLETQAVIGELDIIPDGRKVGLLRDPGQAIAQGMVEARGGLNYAQDTDVSRDGRVLFVSRGYLGDVIAMDIATGDILWRTRIAGLRADHMDISPDGTKLYVAALIRSGNIAEVIDTRTGKKLGNFSTGEWPHDVHVSHDNRHVYVASLGDMQLEPDERGISPDAYTVTKADAVTFDVLEEYRFDAGIRPFQVTRDEQLLYAQLSNTHAIIKRSLASGETLTRIDLPVADGVSEEDWDFDAPHHGLALTSDETRLCVAGRASDYAAIVRAEDLSLMHTIPLGNAPSWAALSSDDRLCVLANTRSDDVSIIDMQAGDELVRLKAGRGPKHISIGRVPEGVLP